MTVMETPRSILEPRASECWHTDGAAVSAVGGDVRPDLGRKSKFWHSPVSTEADTVLGTPSQCG
ncbi:hypothetical protein [Planktothrix serta]